MVEKEGFQGSETYKCEECGLHYETEEQAEECENFCRDKGVCDFDITTESKVETEKSLERRAIT
jgi:hypothetical protein